MSGRNVLAISFVALLGACTNPASFKISGSVENANDGEQVYLLKVDGTAVDTIDVTTVKGNGFEFKGVASEPALRYLKYGNGMHDYAVEVFIEPGNIEAIIDERGYAKGTVDNDLLSDFKMEQWGIRDEISSKYNELQSCSNESVYKELVDSINSYVERLSSSAEDFAKENIGTPAGLFVFSELMDGFMSYDKMEEIYSMIPDKDSKSELMNDVVSKYEKAASTMPGKKIKDFTMSDMNGQEKVFSAIIAGKKLTLVDFWASWCTPCMRGVPELKALAKQYEGQDVQIVGISLDKSRENWLAAVEKNEMQWLHLSDLQGWGNEAAQMYNIKSIPAFMLVDNEGLIIAKGLPLSEMADIISEKLN